MALGKVGSVVIDRVVVGPIQTNCYILKGVSGCVVIDPGDEPVTIERALDGALPQAIVLTHRHYDHIGALAWLVRLSHATVYAHALDADAIEQPARDGSLVGSLPTPEGATVDVRLADGDVVRAGDVSLRVTHTPGHTIGGVCLVLSDSQGADAALFSGDTLFAQGIGRTDFETGDYDQIVSSIRTRLAPLDDAVAVLPGHGPASTVAAERLVNPLMRQ